MDFAVVLKFAIGALISLGIASFASMSSDVTTNKVRIDNLQDSVKRTEKMVHDLHWHILKRDK